MKERYFTEENLAKKAQEMLLQLKPEIRTRCNQVSPEKSALLVLDMQDYFLQPAAHAYIPSAEAILPRINSLVQAYNSLSLPIFFTRHLNQPQNARQMAIWWQDLISASNPLSRITAMLDTSAGEVIIKSQYDAFFETNLDVLLRKRGVSQVVIGGVMTHLCCETTARSAFMHGYEVFFLIDGTATYHETFHRATLLNLGHGFATLTLVKEITAALEKYRHAT